MTPEGRVKKAIKEYLSTLHDTLTDVGLYYEMPVPTGYGKSGLDFTLCLWGHFVAIEAKASTDEKLTPRQRARAVDILRAGGTVFIISGPEGLRSFMDWVEKCRRDFAGTAGN
jgi:hypothetical protein